MKTIGFIGGGNMAEALIKGILSAKVYKADEILTSDINLERLKYLATEYGIDTTKTNPELAAEADVVVLSVKPQNMMDVLRQIKPNIKDTSLIISIAAGKRVRDIESVLGDIPVIRVMPNTPALIGEGASAIFANEKAKGMLKETMSIFSSVGKAVVIEDEDLMDAVTALSGSGPAYYFLLMEAMVQAGVELGLSEDAAKELVLQTAKGSALLAATSTKTPAQLRRQVTSPGGTTEAALKTLAEGKFGELVTAAIKKACQRSCELSTEG